MGNSNWKAKQSKSTETNNHEMYFEWYLEELEANGYINGFDREPETLLVIPPYVHQRERHLKKLDNPIDDFTLINALEYTYDYRIRWNEKAMYIFTDVFDPDKPFKFGQPVFTSHWINIDGFTELVSYVDVKPHFVAAQFGGGMSSFYTFPIIQKILMFTRSIFINKATPIPSGKHGVNTCLFATTFVPNRFLFTDKNAQQRTIKFRKIPITGYVNRMQNIIDTYNENERVKNGQQSLL